MDQMVDAKKEYGYRLTTQTPAGKENDPVLFPDGEDSMMIGEVSYLLMLIKT